MINRMNDLLARPNEKITATKWNKLIKEMKRLQVRAGTGINAHYGPAGTVLSSAAKAGAGGSSTEFQLITSSSEPAADVWRRGGFWIRTYHTVGGHYEMYAKTDTSEANNDAKVLLSTIIVSDVAPAAGVWQQGSAWVDSDDVHDGYCQVWLNTKDSTTENKHVPIALMTS